MPIIDPLSYGQHQWQNILSDYDNTMRSQVRELVLAHSRELTDNFYQQMMEQPEAREFLAHEIVNQRLKASMILWLEQAFSIQDTTAIPAAVERQFEVGKVHARINLPINLVSLGARLHKRRLLELISQLWSEPADWLPAAKYLQDVMDLSLELMSLAYVTKSDRKSRAAEAYRLHTLSLNLSVERERQRAALLDWSHELMFALHSGESSLKGLSRSEFGLWFYHQAVTIFDGAPELNQIEQVLQQIDLVLLPDLQASILPQASVMVGKMALLQQEVKAIIYFMSTMFDRYIEIDQGRDTLTRLLDRRFLPAVMNREVKLAKRNNGVFSVVLFDIDHFKAINDNHGHEGGDMVLQQVANLVAGAVRSSDFVFRYGGEELLVVLVEVSAANALKIAQNIRTKLMESQLKLPNNNTQQVTMSGGVATFDGHPDYEHLINRADKALYGAKSMGRNTCLLGD
ncbi:MAG: GGDEF domain-containing protein [Oceanisphaera sp.]|uniref:GGDEF domain-containing protein n=1 Tax=Oceanisphaera sp. TaxID=1929979 RepID=UPI003F9AAFF9